MEDLGQVCLSSSLQVFLVNAFKLCQMKFNMIFGMDIFDQCF
jgi:hypothetical protein